MAGEPLPRRGVALVIGVGDYLNPGIEPLRFATADAQAIATVLADPDVCGFPAVDVHLLCDAHATRDNVVRELQESLPQRSKGADLVVIYLAGHGIVRRGKQEEGYFLPHDADPKNPAARGISMADLSKWLDDLDPKASVLLCLDCCHAAQALTPRGDGPVPRDIGLRPSTLEVVAGKGRFLLAACDAGQQSVEDPALGHGLFTYHLVSGIKGLGDRDQDGQVGITELFEYVAREVEKAAAAYSKPIQQKPWQSVLGSAGVYLSDPAIRKALRGTPRVAEQLTDEDKLIAQLRGANTLPSPAAAILVVPHLVHDSESVRCVAKEAFQAIGKDATFQAIDGLARLKDTDPAKAELLSVLNGLFALEASTELIAFLDRIHSWLAGELSARARVLLDRKRVDNTFEVIKAQFEQDRRPYRLVRVLRLGLITAAYEAIHVETESRVVVRILREEFARESEISHLFREVSRRAYKAPSHQNLVRTLDTQADHDRRWYYAIRDFVEGDILRDVIARERFDPPRVIDVVRQLLGGLSSLHRAGVCHGGVNPSNVYVCSNNHYMLGDLSPPTLFAKLGKDSRFAYNFRYVAPEVFRDDAISPATNIYSLGCVTYELFCGTPPFVEEKPFLLQKAHNDAPIPRVATRRPADLPPLPPAVDDLLAKLLAKNPDDRPRDALAALRELDALHTAIQATTITSIPPTPPTPPSPRLQPDVKPQSAVWLPDDPLSVVALGEAVPGTVSQCAPDEARAMQLAVTTFPTVPRKQPVTLGDAGSLTGSLDAIGSQGDPVSNPSTFTQVADDMERARTRSSPAFPEIPNYEIIVELGRGGMAIVYAAHSLSLRRIVALKVLRHTPEQVPNLLKRFMLEHQITTAIRHPNVIEVYECGRVPNHPYIAMEFLKGGSLASRLNTRRILLPHPAAKLLAQIARGAAAAHAQGIVHRDLKPSNVLFDHDGEPKIIDFGVGKLAESKLTIAGQILGTPDYMSPEQASGNSRSVGSPADVWSLGVMLYECLAGQRPFVADQAVAVLRMVIDTEPISLQELDPSIPPELEAICRKCLEKDPARRYPTADELATELERFASQ